MWTLLNWQELGSSAVRLSNAPERALNIHVNLWSRGIGFLVHITQRMSRKGCRWWRKCSDQSSRLYVSTRVCVLPLLHSLADRLYNMFQLFVSMTLDVVVKYIMCSEDGEFKTRVFLDCWWCQKVSTAKGTVAALISLCLTVLAAFLNRLQRLGDVSNALSAVHVLCAWRAVQLQNKKKLQW